MRIPTEPDYAQTSDEQRAIPFDYTFRFDLRGEIDRVHRGVITISVESSFTAVSIGYGLVPRVTPIIFGPVVITVNPATLPAGQVGEPYNQTITQTGGAAPVVFSVSEGSLPNGLTLSSRGELSGTPTVDGVFLITIRATDDEGSFGERAYALEITSVPTIPIALSRVDVSLPNLRAITINNLLNGLQRALAQTPDPIRGETGPEAAFKGGIKLNPQFAELALLNDGQNAVSDEETLQSLFQVVSAPSNEIQFLYALFDEGSGREFQSEPLLNIAGLGASNGERPFRYFARPITFEPRSTIRLEITEKSDFPGELHISLHGYKVLGAPGAPTAGTGRGDWRRR